MLSLSLSHSLLLSLSRFLCLSFPFYIARCLSPVCVCGGTGVLSPEREPRKQKNHAAEQHVCCARADRTSHPRRVYLLLSVNFPRLSPRGHGFTRFHSVSLGSTRFHAVWTRLIEVNLVYKDTIFWNKKIGLHKQIKQRENRRLIDRRFAEHGFRCLFIVEFYQGRESRFLS